MSKNICFCAFFFSRKNKHGIFVGHLTNQLFKITKSLYSPFTPLFAVFSGNWKKKAKQILRIPTQMILWTWELCGRIMHNWVDPLSFHFFRAPDYVEFRFLHSSLLSQISSTFTFVAIDYVGHFSFNIISLWLKWVDQFFTVCNIGECQQTTRIFCLFSTNGCQLYRMLIIPPLNGLIDSNFPNQITSNDGIFVCNAMKSNGFKCFVIELDDL